MSLAQSVSHSTNLKTQCSCVPRGVVDNHEEIAVGEGSSLTAGESFYIPCAALERLNGEQVVGLLAAEE